MSLSGASAHQDAPGVIRPTTDACGVRQGAGKGGDTLADAGRERAWPVIVTNNLPAR
jgi:hypothetical protein